MPGAVGDGIADDLVLNLIGQRHLYPRVGPAVLPTNCVAREAERTHVYPVVVIREVVAPPNLVVDGAGHVSRCVGQPGSCLRAFGGTQVVVQEVVRLSKVSEVLRLCQVAVFRAAAHRGEAAFSGGDIVGVLEDLGGDRVAAHAAYSYRRGSISVEEDPEDVGEPLMVTGALRAQPS